MLIRTKCRQKLAELVKDERGLGTVEIILIMVVLIGLVIIFKTQLTSLVGTVFNRITEQSNTILAD
ncbi:MAG: hypothetical protein IJV26_00510 [Lachnospiraceae bacterium]|nr:hypothetical protein [Lachnospiraceae bacterium]MBQ9642504.1 hypothetical protein [Lachnospiraceae bacterium]